eukprot:3687338-Rhodomonas_salina.1
MLLPGRYRRRPSTLGYLHSWSSPRRPEINGEKAPSQDILRQACGRVSLLPPCVWLSLSLAQPCRALVFCVVGGWRLAISHLVFLFYGAVAAFLQKDVGREAGAPPPDARFVVRESAGADLGWGARGPGVAGGRRLREARPREERASRCPGHHQPPALLSLLPSLPFPLPPSRSLSPSLPLRSLLVWVSLSLFCFLSPPPAPLLSLSLSLSLSTSLSLSLSLSLCPALPSLECGALV